MIFKTYKLNIEQWEDYFMNQVKGNEQRKKNSGQSIVSGGIDHGEDSESLSVVGSFKKKNSPEDPITLTMTSPASATVEMAKSELVNIKDEIHTNIGSSKRSLKRKSSSSANKRDIKKKRNNNQVNSYKDLFSRHGNKS